MDKKREKKRVGRPRKNPPRRKYSIHGISPAPRFREDVVEYSNSEPIDFKKLWGFLKNMRVGETEMMFRHNSINIYGNGHTDQNSVYIILRGDKAIHYYCKSPFKIGLSRLTVGPYMSTINNKTEKLDIVSKSGHEQKTIRFVMETQLGLVDDNKINVTTNYNILTQEQEAMFCDDENYKIKFVMPWKDFKQKINNIKTVGASDFTFKMDHPDDHLTIEYKNKNKDGSTDSMFVNNKKIQLESKLKGDNSFRVRIQLQDIESISTALLSDTVQICLDERRDVLLISQMSDNAIEVRTLVKILDVI
jgi:hypothetical protein